MPRIPVTSSSLSEYFGYVTKHVSTFLDYLQLPSRPEYWKALQQAGNDVYIATKSVNQLSFLTFRPLFLLLWWVSQTMYLVGKFFFRHLFQGLYLSTRKSVQQLKVLGLKLVQWQYARTANQLKMEVSILLAGVLLYLLRKHIQKQLYVQRVTRWYRVKQQRTIKLYRSTLDRISRTSLIVAMLLPHALFVGVCITIKLLFSSTVTWLARDTYAIFILSTLYPWIWTVALLFQYRHPTLDADDDDDDDDDASIIASNITDNDTIRAPTKQQPQQQQQQPQQRRIPLKDRSTTTTVSPTRTIIRASRNNTSNIYPQTTKYNTPKNQTGSRSSIKKKKQQQPKTPVQRLLAASRGERNNNNNNNNKNSNHSMEMEAKYWMQYWIVYCLFSGCGTLLSLAPIFGKIASRSVWLQHFAFEFQFLFYLWIYGLGSVLTSTASSDADMQRTYLIRPLPFLMKRISPFLQTLYKATSEQLMVTPEVWNNTVVEKIKMFLNLAVMMRLLSESHQDRLLQSLVQAHPFVVPAISLLLPSFLTKYGVLYVKTIVPSAKAASIINITNTSNNNNKAAALSLETRMVTLQYWVVHVIVSGTLSWWSGLLWWIPFSTHATFLLWCHLQVVTTATTKSLPKDQQQQRCYYYYSILEQELQAFGLLPKGTAEQVMAVEKTVTATMLRRLAKSLPSASDDDENVVAENTVPPAFAVKDVEGTVPEPGKKAPNLDDPAPSNDSTESSALRRSTRVRKVRNGGD